MHSVIYKGWLHVWFFQNSCVTSKLRDLLYVVLNHPVQSCMKRPRMMLLKRKVQNLYTIITRLCYRVRTSHMSAASLCASPCVHVCVCVCVAGPGVFNGRLWGHWYWTRHSSLRRGQASAVEGGKMSRIGSLQHTYTHTHSTHRACPHPPTAADALANIGGCIPAWCAELSTGNLLNANHTKPLNNNVNMDACEPA